MIAIPLDTPGSGHSCVLVVGNVLACKARSHGSRSRSSLTKHVGRTSPSDVNTMRTKHRTR